MLCCLPGWNSLAQLEAVALLGRKFMAVLGHLCFLDQRSHVVKHANNQGQHTQATLWAMAPDARRRTLTISYCQGVATHESP